ncbi:hypothetical protein RB195_023060 [Necator americanus]|uniref:Uncharacterized protein n=1 Tax=Necator americanus TaxID=51031 RepID=A0ABR1EHS4_NECAM
MSSSSDQLAIDIVELVVSLSAAQWLVLDPRHCPCHIMVPSVLGERHVGSFDLIAANSRLLFSMHLVRISSPQIVFRRTRLVHGDSSHEQESISHVPGYSHAPTRVFLCGTISSVLHDDD